MTVRIYATSGGVLNGETPDPVQVRWVRYKLGTHYNDRYQCENLGV